MADISKIKLPNGVEYNIKDETARSQSGVTGVKGSAESSYRTGQVNLTAANVKAYQVGSAVSHRNPNNTSAEPASTILTTEKNALDYQILRAVAGVGDWFYAVHNNPDYTVTCNYSGRHGTKGNFAISTLFFPSAASTVLLDKDSISTTPFVLTIQKKSGIITATDVVHLELFGHTLSDTGSYMTDYKVELYTTGSTAASGTYSWQTVYERHGVKDRPHGLAITLNPTEYSYLYFSGLRFTIEGIGGVSTNTNSWNYNCLDLSLFRLMDQRPAFSAARSIGALDINGGEVYGVAYFKNGLNGNVTGNVSGTASNVTGTVAVANGGTGKTTANDAADNLISGLPAWTANPTDDTYFVRQDTGGTSTFGRVKFSTLWNYIKGKFSGTSPITFSNGAIGINTASTSAYGATKLSTATNSTATDLAATPSAVKTAYDLANTANGTANTALSGVNGTLIYDHTYSISNGVATFTAHVYQKGVEVTNNYADSCFEWSYKLASAVTGTPSVVSLGTGKTKTITISTLGYGGYVLGTFTPA